jgi:protein AroM
VTLSAAAVSSGLQSLVDRAEDSGTGVIVILCTGEFPELRSRDAWLIEPDAVVTRTAQSLLGDQRVGILVPRADQIAPARAKWSGLRQPRFGVGSPYGDEALLVDAARDLIDAGVQALVLDCMGYAPRHRAALRDAGIRVPVLVSGGVVGAVLGAAL